MVNSFFLPVLQVSAKICQAGCDLPPLAAFQTVGEEPEGEPQAHLGLMKSYWRVLVLSWESRKAEIQVDVML